MANGQDIQAAGEVAMATHRQPGLEARHANFAAGRPIEGLEERTEHVDFC